MEVLMWLSVIKQARVELRGSEPPASGEQNTAGTEPSERGAGTAGDSRGSGNFGNGGESEAATHEERLTKKLHPHYCQNGNVGCYRP